MICIAGQNNIAVNFAEFLIKNNYQFIACTNRSDSGVNTFNRSFKSFCILNNIEIKVLDDLYELDNLIFISLEFDQIINPLKFKTKFLFNLHFSLLPKYKGMYTSSLPILNGEKYSGVTIHEIDNGIDTGDILYQRKFSIENLNCEQLYNKYCSQGFELLKENFSNLISNKYVKKKQDKRKSTYFSKKTIDYKNLTINLNKTANEIECQVRAFYFPNKQYPVVLDRKIYKCEILKERSFNKPGEIIFENTDYIKISSIDFNLKLYKLNLDDLFLYARNGYIDKIIDLLNKNHNIKIRDIKGWDILIVSTYNGKIELVKFLIEVLNWDVNTINFNGTSFLMYAMTYASKSNDLRILEYSLNLNGLDFQHKDYRNKNVFEYALEYGNIDVINLLNQFKC
jgi:methionyl-tRNA formyltransferase